jgi:hypothetical protein
MGDRLLSACTDTSGRNVNCDEKQLSGGRELSCSFYLYRFRKYVTYGFPIINFCNPGVHYETHCIKTLRLDYKVTRRQIPDNGNLSYRCKNLKFRKVQSYKVASQCCEKRFSLISIHLPREATGLPLDGFSRNCTLEAFIESFGNIQFLIRRNKNIWHLARRSKAIHDFSLNYYWNKNIHT